MRRPLALALVALVALVVAGCAAPAAPEDGRGGATFVACEHPWPCADGSEWPRDLVGPFNISSIERVQVASHDGTLLTGWVALPDTPEGVRLPVVLHSTPYVGSSGDTPASRGFWEDDSMGPMRYHYIERGYAVVTFQVRGTGASGGCLGYFGLDEQLDQRVLVEWAGEQSWSNGRVGFVGLSYHGTTPIEAAIQAPPALKTIVVAGIISDLYTGFHTPQGALRHVGVEQAVLLPTSGPFDADAADEGELVPWSAVARERACPEAAAVFGEGARGAFTDERAGPFWEERLLLRGVPNITAAVLLAHGFHDNRLHGYQDDPFLELLPATTPKAAYLGQWSHEWPMTNGFRAEWIVEDWEERQFRWLDFWLKGQGEPPEELGVVRYQDDAGAWHGSSTWPPAEASPRALYLADDALAAAPSARARSFLSAPDAAGSEAADETIGSTSGEAPGPVCADALGAVGRPRVAAFVSEPLEGDTLLAGRAFAALTLRANEPGGRVHATLLDLAPDFACDARGVPSGARWLAMGTADLRFHAGGYRGAPFPVDQPTFVRLDLLDLAAFVPAGHRVGLFLSQGDPTWARHLERELGVDIFPGDAARKGVRQEALYAPLVTVEPQSHLVLPVVEGTLGVTPPLAHYPPRPFTVQG
ncbi:MAG TPA: CocE/NonD family hydrolase [Candidatus Thermoplasmatota archaeon]|nr:CocE/NonD family hydrolase [Candidatus Thermoplasmatota archaeon]